MKFEEFFSYKYTVIRILITIAILTSVGIDNVSNYEDVIVDLGGAIVGSVISEIFLRMVFRIFIQKR